MILGICESPNVLEIMNIVVTIIKVIMVVVPIVLLFSLIFKAVSAATKGNDDALAMLKKKAVPNIVATAAIFLVPTLVSLIVTISFPESDYNKCIKDISSVTIQEAYEDKAESLVRRAEATLNISDYTNAMNYLENVKDGDKRTAYEARLAEVKKQIDENRQGTLAKLYDKVNYNDFKWTYYKTRSGPASNYYDNMTPYYVWGPEDASSLNGVSLPLIVWLHGAGETAGKISGTSMLNVSFFKTVSNMVSEYNLKPVPAIIVAPQSNTDPEQGGWGMAQNYKSIDALINYAISEYNIDESKIVIMGHSMGGYGARLVATKNQGKYYGVVIMSASPKKSTDVDYFSSPTLKVWGYSEASKSKEFFDIIGRPENFTLFKGASHGNVPVLALTEDSNNDGVSDLMQYLFGDAKIASSNKPIEKRFFIGDSRTVGMGLAVDDKKHFNGRDMENGTATYEKDTWSAKSAQGFTWMTNVGIPNIENQLDDTSALIILMGVNDMGTEGNTQRYINYFNQKIPEWTSKGTRVYFAAVFPCSDDQAKKNRLINAFNSEMSKIEGLNYIDTHEYIVNNKIKTSDGLHYGASANKNIYQYIIDNLE